MAGLSRAPLFLLALALALALTASSAAGANANAGRPRLVGGLAEADVNEEGVQQALSFALSEYNKASNDAYHSRAMQVVRARKQVVAGMNYFLDVKIGRTTCTKSQPNLAACPFHEQPNLKKEALCSFQIYTVPWLGKTSLVKSSCKNA
ncbi:cystatin-C [Pipistrellus kuhlii]|uniref:Cystatin C n=1 Tax=Pipistrellus kuhlii TaxID=59472 RepID=A0A7J7Y7W0_PIPKU|nr:cystatin-C [Pipistrellus kuhlii]KAF6358053.1 cystatin C [Pipistrellus kuhlii]